MTVLSREVLLLRNTFHAVHEALDLLCEKLDVEDWEFCGLTSGAIDTIGRLAEIQDEIPDLYDGSSPSTLFKIEPRQAGVFGSDWNQVPVIAVVDSQDMELIAAIAWEISEAHGGKTVSVREDTESAGATFYSSMVGGC